MPWIRQGLGETDICDSSQPAIHREFQVSQDDTVRYGQKQANRVFGVKQEITKRKKFKQDFSVTEASLQVVGLQDCQEAWRLCTRSLGG